MDETWEAVLGYEGLKEVSTDGRVKSAPRRGTRGGILKLSVRRDGYAQVNLYRDGVERTPRVHRLVMEAFAGPCPPGLETRHLDGDRLNNTVDNLRYGTHAENVQDSIRHGTNAHLNKTHCSQGHPFNEENTYRRPDARPACRECNRVACRARYAARRASVDVDGKPVAA